MEVISDEKIIVKARYRDDIRRFSVSPTICFSEFVKELDSLFAGLPLDVAFKYTDNESDLISITTDKELEEAFQISKADLLRVSITRPGEELANQTYRMLKRFFLKNIIPASSPTDGQQPRMIQTEVTLDYASPAEPQQIDDKPQFNSEELAPQPTYDDEYAEETSPAQEEECKTNNINQPDHNAFCNNCGKDIYGIRYKCGNCEDFDLCSACEEQWSLDLAMHDTTHVFLKIYVPLPDSRSIGMHLPTNLYQVDDVQLEEEQQTTAENDVIMSQVADDLDEDDQEEEELVEQCDQQAEPKCIDQDDEDEDEEEESSSEESSNEEDEDEDEESECKNNNRCGEEDNSEEDETTTEDEDEDEDEDDDCTEGEDGAPPAIEMKILSKNSSYLDDNKEEEQVEQEVDCLEDKDGLFCNADSHDVILPVVSAASCNAHVAAVAEHVEKVLKELALNLAQDNTSTTTTSTTSSTTTAIIPVVETQGIEEPAAPVEEPMASLATAAVPPSSEDSAATVVSSSSSSSLMMSSTTSTPNANATTAMGSEGKRLSDSGFLSWIKAVGRFVVGEDSTHEFGIASSSEAQLSGDWTLVLDQFEEMGFKDKELNKSLMMQNRGDVDAVLSQLLK